VSTDSGVSQKSQPHDSEPARTATDADALGRSAQLLEEARALIMSAGQVAANRDAELFSRIADLEGNLREVEELLARTEQQAAQLAGLYVATYQLHASLETRDVLSAVADIAVNLLGAEVFSIWTRDEQGRFERAPESSDTTDSAQSSGRSKDGDALFEACTKAARPQFGPTTGADQMAAVPFVAQGEVVGVLLVERFLRHKQAITSQDWELLDLLAAHAASALLAARAFAIARRKLQTYEGLLGFLRQGAP
jgi:GAF domain-containing protein